MADDYEKVLVNGRIFSMDAGRSWKEAAIIRGDRIWRTGSTAEMKAAAAAGAEVVDLGGRFAMPGFIDAHVHFQSGGMSLIEIRLKDCGSVDELELRLREYAAKLPAGTWITGGGWDHEIWPDKRLPTAQALDSAAPNHPVFLSRHDGHMGVANSIALKLAGVTATTPVPEGGEIGKDSSGKLDGILRDNAMSLVESKIPAPSKEHLERAIEAGQAEANRLGVTGVMDMNTTSDAMAAYLRAHNSGHLRVRIFACPGIETTPELSKLGIGTGLGSAMFRVQGVKILLDGSMGSGTALFFEPYADRPHTSGLSLYPEADVFPLLQKADAAGLQLNVHAIGDRAIRMALDAFDRLPPKDRRAKIEHVQVVRRSDYELFRKTGAIASVEPCHLLDDMHWCEKRVGERCKDGYPYGSLRQAGVPLALGTDWPVEPLNPWLGIYAAVTRKDLRGLPQGGWFPEERLSLADALHDYTAGSAYAGFMDKELGSIEPGKLADIVVTDRNPFDIAPETLKDISTWMTILNGKIVYRAE